MENSSTPDKLRTLAVLVVDDHAINREFLRAGLQGCVDRIETVTSGQEAIERCQDLHYDVVLMDLHMPQMDGLTTVHRIRDLENSSARARMVILTADARPEERSRLLAEGIDAYLNKPLSIEDLKQTIRALFEPARMRAQQTKIPDPDVDQLIDVARLQASDLGSLLSSELLNKLPELDRMLAEQRIVEAGKLLHQWTGAAGFAGAPRLSRACSRLNQCLKSEAASSTGTAYVDFLRTAHATREALDNAMPPRASA